MLVCQLFNIRLMLYKYALFDNARSLFATSVNLRIALLSRGKVGTWTTHYSSASITFTRKIARTCNAYLAYKKSHFDVKHRPIRPG